MVLPVEVTQKHLLNGHLGAVYTLHAISQNELLSAGSDGYVVLWNLNNPDKGLAIIQIPGVIYALESLPASPQVWVGTDKGIIHIVDRWTNREIKAIDTQVGSIFKLMHMGDVVLSSHASGHIGVWDSLTAKCIRIIKVSDDKIRDFVLDADQKLLAIASTDNFVYLYSWPYFTFIHQFEAHQPACNSVLFLPQNNQLITAGRDAHINVWDIKTSHALKKIPAHNFAIYSLQLSPDGKFILSASRDKTAKLWTTDTHELIKRITPVSQGAHTYSINKAIWLSNSEFATAGDDRTVRVWKINYSN